MNDFITIDPLQIIGLKSNVTPYDNTRIFLLTFDSIKAICKHINIKLYKD